MIRSLTINLASRFGMAFLACVFQLAHAQMTHAQLPPLPDDGCPVQSQSEVASFKARPNYNVCSGYGTSVMVLLDFRVLVLCKDGTTAEAYDVAIGQNGFGKTTQGDLLTPVGTYPLAEPRGSEKFGTFIHVGYPTPEQVKAGYTGSAIGIHGPERHRRCDGLANVATDWTEGCMAVASDSRIQRVAQWLRENPQGRVVHILAKTPPPPR